MRRAAAAPDLVGPDGDGERIERDLGGRARGSEQMALGESAAGVADLGELLRVLNALGDDVDAELARRRGDGDQHGAVAPRARPARACR